MGRVKVPPITKTGRPKFAIDWEEIDKFLMAGCTGPEISAKFGYSSDTLYQRCIREKGKSFSEYCREKRATGDALLRAVQYKKAMNGDNTMMIWLGKNRLEQSERVQTTFEGKVEVTQKALLELPDNERRNLKDATPTITTEPTQNI